MRPLLAAFAAVAVWLQPHEVRAQDIEYHQAMAAAMIRNLKPAVIVKYDGRPDSGWQASIDKVSLVDNDRCAIRLDFGSRRKGTDTTSDQWSWTLRASVATYIVPTHYFVEFRHRSTDEAEHPMLFFKEKADAEAVASQLQQLGQACGASLPDSVPRLHFRNLRALVREGAGLRYLDKDLPDPVLDVSQTGDVCTPLIGSRSSPTTIVDLDFTSPNWTGLPNLALSLRDKNGKSVTLRLPNRLAYDQAWWNVEALSWWCRRNLRPS